LRRRRRRNRHLFVRILAVMSLDRAPHPATKGGERSSGSVPRPARPDFMSFYMVPFENNVPSNGAARTKKKGITKRKIDKK
jgi:hypothetical protein